MKALTVRQPHAGAIVLGHKTVENRTGRPWSHRGPLAIHAGTRTAAPWAFRQVTGLTGLDVTLGQPYDPPQWRLGAVVGVVTVTGAHTEDVCGLDCSPWAMPAAGPDGLCDACRDGRCTLTSHAPAVHYELADARILRTPIPAVGRLGLWNLTGYTADRVAHALRTRDWLPGTKD